MSKMSSVDYDVVIVGGGINGAVSAARLSASGIRVLLLEAGDFACTTSQESSNLVWGGIKYMQSYEFALVYKLCRSRNQLLKAYPTRIREIAFLASIGPTSPFGRVLGLLGASLYWGIGAFKTHSPRTYSAAKAHLVEPSFIKGRPALEYYDAQLPDNDSRFVWEFISTAQRLGGECLNYQRVTDAKFDGTWKVEFTNQLTGETRTTTSKVLINATGPYANGISDQLGLNNKSRLALSKGVHLVVPKIHSSDRVLAFWDEQGRMFYVLPMHDKSVIGTTDTRMDHVTNEVTDEDRDFLLRQINAQMSLPKPLTKEDIISERAGVRPLVTSGGNSDEIDWHKLSRKHVVETDSAHAAVTLFGGKLTDCLNIGEEVIDAVGKLGIAPTQATAAWFGEDSAEDMAKFLGEAQLVLGEIADGRDIAAGIWRRHGNRGFEILSAIKANREDGQAVFEGLDICRAEINHVLRYESVQTPEDLLRRRLPITMTRGVSEIEKNEFLQQKLARLAKVSA